MSDISGRILLIDDEASLRQTLTRILQRAGFDVTTAADGPEALRLQAAGTYNLVLLDIRLPGMDGLEVLQAIRGSSSTTTLPVVLLTAHGSLHSALEALRLGATDYLLKPVKPEVLLERVRAILQAQMLDRRRRELRDQIERLQVELRALEQGLLPEAVAERQPLPGEERYLHRGRLALDLQARRAAFGEKNLDVPPSTFDYLVVLARHAPDVVDYQRLVSEAQAYQVDGLEARELAKWHIHVLRQALEPDTTQPQHVLNVRGAGYRLLVD